MYLARLLRSQAPTRHSLPRLGATRAGLFLACLNKRLARISKNAGTFLAIKGGNSGGAVQRRQRDLRTTRHSMRRLRLQADLSARDWSRIVLLTICGTLFCIGMSFLVDNYSFLHNRWQPGSDPLNDLLIPLILAPPFFSYLLYKQQQLANAHLELLKVASTDGLTSCLNRQAFTVLVEAYLERTARLATLGAGALMVIDVDHFKAVNDRFGHMSGDEALRMISREIKESVRENDLVGRIGGEEFGVFLLNADRSEAGLVAERIRASVNAAPFSPQGGPVPLSVSVGATLYSARSSFKEMFSLADECLYVAKSNGRNRVEFSDPHIRSGAASMATGEAGFSAALG
jgi:diguanylate cyclase